MESIQHLVTINKQFKNSTMASMNQESDQLRGTGSFDQAIPWRLCSYQAFTGRIEGVNQARALLKVKVEIFGRETPIKLNFSQVKNLRAP